MKSFLSRFTILAVFLAALFVSPFAHADTASVAPGTKVTISVTAGGTAPFTYQWRKATVAAPTPVNYGAEGPAASIVFNTITAADAGIYSVIVKNSAGQTISDNGTITIINSPNGATITITVG